MPALNHKPSHKVIKDYYQSLDEFDQYGLTHESAVRSEFQSLLEGCGKQRGWKLIPEDSISLGGNKRIFVDGALIDKFKLPQGYWEAKDIHDEFAKRSPSQVQGRLSTNEHPLPNPKTSHPLKFFVSQFYKENVLILIFYR